METIYAILNDLRPEFDFHTSTNYIDDGMLDSFDVISMVTEIEDKFGILIDALDILPENFATAEAIAETIKKNGGTVE